MRDEVHWCAMLYKQVQPSYLVSQVHEYNHSYIPTSCLSAHAISSNPILVQLLHQTTSRNQIQYNGWKDVYSAAGVCLVFTCSFSASRWPIDLKLFYRFISLCKRWFYCGVIISRMSVTTIIQTSKQIVHGMYAVHCAWHLKEHIALDRTSWSMKSVWNRLLWNAYGYKDVLKVEYNDPHKYHSKLHGF